MITQWNDKEVLAAAQMKVKAGLRACAEHVEKIAERRVHVKSGDLKAAIQVKESQFENGGYLVGVFDQSGKQFKDSLGGRAVFVEYGHAAPNMGRGKVKRKSIVKSVPEYPFIRPAVRSMKRISKRFFEGIL